MPTPHPVHLEVSGDLRRSRLTSFFRPILAIPHLIWLSIWGIAAVFAVIANWFATLFAGRSPEGLHRFLAHYLAYATKVFAYLHLLAEPFPPFDGRPGYEVALVVAPPERQNRATVAFRLILAIPVLIVMHVLTYLMGVLALVSWVVSVVLGRLPHGLRSLGLWCLRFQQQTAAYTHLITQRYPSFDVDGGDPAPATGELSPAS